MFEGNKTKTAEGMIAKDGEYVPFTFATDCSGEVEVPMKLFSVCLPVCLSVSVYVFLSSGVSGCRTLSLSELSLYVSVSLSLMHFFTARLGLAKSLVGCDEEDDQEGNVRGRRFLRRETERKLDL